MVRKKLAAPPKQVSVVTGAKTADDPDGCGIPHDVKRQYGLPEEVAENTDKPLELRIRLGNGEAVTYSIQP